MLTELEQEFNLDVGKWRSAHDRPTLSREQPNAVFERLTPSPSKLSEPVR